jgi:WD40 repeat protein
MASSLMMSTQNIDNIEFSPRVPQPNSYTKVRSRNKKEKEFERLFLAQELNIKEVGEKPGRASGRMSRAVEASDASAVWALVFSLDGRYLAAAGQNHVVKVWSVLASAEEREEQEAEDDEEDHADSAVNMRASIFKTTPVRVYKDHTGPVWDLNWSKVSLSMLTPVSTKPFARIISSFRLRKTVPCGYFIPRRQTASAPLSTPNPYTQSPFTPQTTASSSPAPRTRSSDSGTLLIKRLNSTSPSAK